MTFSTYKFKITESQIHNDTFCILTSFLGSLIRYSHLYNCVPLLNSSIKKCTGTGRLPPYLWSAK